jgi:glucokinase
MEHERRPIFVSYSLGIDLGGTSVKTVCVNRDGESLHKQQQAFDPAATMDWAETIRSVIRQTAEAQGSGPEGIGLSAPGLAAVDGLSIARMPGRLQGLEGLNWTQFLQTARPVPVLNDAHAALLGERWLGAARGFENVFMLTLGTGVGGAAIVDGRLLKGRLGRAGHLGHVSVDIDGPRDICRMPGSIEVMIGNCTVEDRSNGRFATTHALVAAHEQDDQSATEIWLQSVRALGCLIAGLTNVLDPEAVIIGGGIARSGKALFEPLEAFVRDMEWDVGATPVKLLAAELGEFAGAFGAAFNAMNTNREPLREH